MLRRKISKQELTVLTISTRVPHWETIEKYAEGNNEQDSTQQTADRNGNDKNL